MRFRKLTAVILFAGTCALPASRRPAVISHANDAATKAVFAPIHAVTADDEHVLGDPAVAGKPFVMRIRELPGTITPSHTHSFDENLTVVQGTWYFGIGEEFDPAKLHELPTGSFVFVPAGTPMFGYAPDGVTVQVHGVGPFTQKFCHALVTLDSSTTGGSSGASPISFKFRKGEVVMTPRGSGQVQQAYATGNVVEYEIVGANGNLFMAQEHEMSKRESP